VGGKVAAAAAAAAKAEGKALAAAAAAAAAAEGGAFTVAAVETAGMAGGGAWAVLGGGPWADVDGGVGGGGGGGGGGDGSYDTAALEAAARAAASPGEYVCPTCGREFSSPQGLGGHRGGKCGSAQGGVPMVKSSGKKRVREASAAAGAGEVDAPAADAVPTAAILAHFAGLATGSV
jgi:DNA-directed RNA polymerase subunit RPC12/RpoP